MLDLRKAVKSLIRHRGQWDRLMQAASARRNSPQVNESPVSHLREVMGFGSNPGALRMFMYVPERLPSLPALVVALHGCTQNAAGYDHGTGWSALARRYGFAVLLPEQQPLNNPKNCFSWFQPDDTARGQGEALSIRQMVERAILNYGIDPRRVYVTGLSAGGAMTSVMLATYPDVFAGGAIIAGLPYGAAANVQEAFASMRGRSRAPAEWAELVKRASPHQGPWPKVSIWHGTADATVSAINAEEVLKQWTALHGLSSTPTREDRVNGHSRQVWCSPAGEELIESYTVTGMAHGAPMAIGTAVDQGGNAGAFFLDVGISSSFHIARFWGLAEHAPISAAEEITLAPVPREPLHGSDDTIGESIHIEPPEHDAHAGPFDVQAAITNALKAAGLMK